jgi:hypothetical protein
MARTNLSLGNLYRAVSGSARVAQAVSIGGLGGAAANSAFTSFAVDSITINQPTYTYIVESTTETATFSFGTAGTLHGTKVGSVAANYTVSFNNGNFSVGTATLGASPSFPITPASINLTTYSEASSVLSMTYADGYNLNATNYNTTTTKILYAVDVYNTINQPDFCLLFGTKVTKTDGTIMNIEDLTVGDKIKAWVPDGLTDESTPLDSELTPWRFYMLESNTGSYQEVMVKDMVFNFASGYYDLNNGLIKATGTHPLWVFDSETEKYRFKNVENILPSDLLVTYDETNGVSEVVITDIEVINVDVEIATINVENADVFLANGVVSHNKGTTTQPYIPSSGLKMYVDTSKAYSFTSQTLPSAGALTGDWIDLSGYNTGVRPAGVTNAASITGGNPSYVAGTTPKLKYLSFNGTNNFLYKDTTTNINGGIAQFNTNTGTIHMWIQPQGTLGTTTRHLFDYAGYYGIAVESSNSSTFDRLKFYGSALGNSSQFTTSLTAGTWYMISVSFQPSGTVTVYVDGSSVGSFTAAAFTAPSSTNYLTIGTNSARTTFWNGYIGPTLFYSTTQSSTAVTQVYNYFSPSYK